MWVRELYRQKQKEVDVREGDELRDNFNYLNTEMWLISDTKKGFNVSFWLRKSCQRSFLVQGPWLLLVWLRVSGLSFMKNICENIRPAQISFSSPIKFELASMTDPAVCCVCVCACMFLEE